MGNPVTEIKRGTRQSFVTQDGVIVNAGGHSEEWMNNFQSHVSRWITGELQSPDNEMSEEEITYVLNNMVDSENNPDIPSGYLTRVENGDHFKEYIKNGLKSGDTIPSDSVFRSYSRTQNATYNYSKKREGDIVIYKTVGNTPSFKATDFDQSYLWEQESFIEQGKMIYLGHHTISSSNFETNEAYAEAVSKELGIDYKGTRYRPASVTIVEVTHESNK